MIDGAATMRPIRASAGLYFLSNFCIEYRLRKNIESQTIKHIPIWVGLLNLGSLVITTVITVQAEKMQLQNAGADADQIKLQGEGSKLLIEGLR